MSSIPNHRSEWLERRLLNSDYSLQDNCITALPTILNQALSSNFLRRRFPASRLWGKRAFFAEPEVPAQIEAISGACMLAKREVVDSVGGFESSYFMYAEDMDLCVRVARAGWKIYYAPEAKIVHHAGGSSATRDESDFSSVMIRESLVHFFQLHRGPLYAACYRASVILSSSIRLVFLCAPLPLLAIAGKRDSMLRAVRKWSNILAWSVGLNPWAAHRPDSPGIPAPVAVSPMKELPGS